MKTVLIVDDSLFMRKSITALLERNNFKVVGEAENGLMAILKYKELKPDIVTMDITMPEMTGMDAVKKIKEIDNNANIIMISSIGQENMVKQSIINGAKNFIIKPFKEEFLVQALNKIK